MLSLLIVDDEERIRQLIAKYARFEGFMTTEAADGFAALELCAKQKFDLIILDIMMPGLDGFSACRELRQYSSAPVVMLSARGEEYDRLHGFELGVDDYVTKPFSPKELMMRVQAIIKRTAGGGQSSQQLSIPSPEGGDGALLINFTARTVTVNGERASLTPKAAELLFFMARNRDIALTREQLITQVWGYDFYGDDRTLDTHVKLIRRVLGEYGRCIVTLRGVGYRFEGEQD